MDIKYDRVADAVYLTVHRSKIAKTLEIKDRLNVDVDASGNIVGIEILEASNQGSLIANLKRNVESGVPIEIVSSTPQEA